MLPFPVPSANVSSSYCNHKKLLLALASADKTPEFINKITHVHKPVLETKKGTVSISFCIFHHFLCFYSGLKRRAAKKPKPFSGMKVSEMLEAREAERQRINEVGY